MFCAIFTIIGGNIANMDARNECTSEAMPYSKLNSIQELTFHLKEATDDQLKVMEGTQRLRDIYYSENVREMLPEALNKYNEQFMSKELTEVLIEIIRKSRTDLSFVKSASEAMVILNEIGFSFKCNLSRSRLPGIKLLNCDLSNCNLKGSNLNSATLYQSMFVNTNLTNSNLLSIKLIECQRSYVHSLAVIAVTFSQDRNYFFSLTNDWTISKWNLNTGKITNAFRLDIEIPIEFALSNNYILFSEKDLGTKLVDLETGETELFISKNEANFSKVTLSANGFYIAAVDANDKFYLWSSELKKCIRTAVYQNKTVNCVTVSLDGSVIVLGNRYGKVEIFYEDQTTSVKSHFLPVSALCVSDDNQLIASGSQDKLIAILDVQSHVQLFILKGMSNWVTSVAFADRYVIGGSSGNACLKVWSLKTGELTHTLIGHFGGISGISASCVDLLSSSSDTLVRWWKLEDVKTTFQGHFDSVNTVSILDDQVTTGSLGGDVKVWNTKSGHVLKSLNENFNSVDSVSISPDKSLMAYVAMPSVIKVVNVDTMAPVYEFNLIGAAPCMPCLIGFSVDGKLLASGNHGNKINVWDMKTGEAVVLDSKKSLVSCVKFSSAYLLSGNIGGSILVWDLNNWNIKHELKEFDGTINDLDISADNQYLIACAYFSSLVVIWNLNKPETLHKMSGHYESVNSVKIFQGYAVSGGYDSILRVWDVKSGELIKLIIGNFGAISSVDISNDGRYIVAGSNDSYVKLFRSKFLDN